MIARWAVALADPETAKDRGHGKQVRLTRQDCVALELAAHTRGIGIPLDVIRAAIEQLMAEYPEALDEAREAQGLFLAVEADESGEVFGRVLDGDAAWEAAQAAGRITLIDLDRIIERNRERLLGIAEAA